MSMEKQDLEAFTAQLNLCDVDTVYHCLRVGTYAKVLLEEYVTRYHPDIDYTPEMLEWAATVHDIGKKEVDSHILQKSAKLTSDEIEKTKQHVRYGDNILSKYNPGKNKKLSKLAHEVILYHHERADGCGYVHGLNADNTPLSAQIVALADCFDALIGARPYKPPVSLDTALEMIENGKCGAFSPKLIACLPVLKKV